MREALFDAYQEIATFGPPHMDRNRHVNNAAYQQIFQLQRQSALEHNQTTIGQLMENQPFVVEFAGVYWSQVYEEDVKATTRIEKYEGTKIRFMQRLYRKKGDEYNEKYTSSLSYCLISPEEVKQEEPSKPVFEYEEQVDINDNVQLGTDPNSEYYFQLWENQRTNYLKSLGLTADNVEQELGLLFVMPKYSGYFLEPLTSGDTVRMKTSIEVIKEWQRTQMLFRQRVIKDGKVAASFKCTVLLVDSEGKSVDLPEQIQNPVDSANNSVSQN